MGVPNPSQIEVAANLNSLSKVVSVPNTEFTSQAIMTKTINASSSLGEALSSKRSPLYNSQSYFSQLLCALGVVPTMTGSTYANQLFSPTQQGSATTTIQGLNGITVNIPTSYFNSMPQDSQVAFMMGYQSSLGRVCSCRIRNRRK